MDEGRLLPLLDLATRRAADAAGALLRCRNQSAREEARLAQLLGFLGDYDSRATALSQWQLVNRAAFLASIRTAITQQREAVDRAREAVDRAIEDWHHRRAGQHRFEALLARERRRRAIHAGHREQRALDDLPRHSTGACP